MSDRLSELQLCAMSLQETVWTTILALIVLCIVGFEIYAFLGRGLDDSFLVAHMRGLARLIARFLHRLKVVRSNSDSLPRTGACIAVANHQSGADPVFLSVTTKRRVRFLMAREYYEARSLHWLFRRLGCIPVNRDGRDLGATKTALKALRAGDAIGIFPEGGIRDGSALDEGKSGVGMLALRTAAPVVPFYIDGFHEPDAVLSAIFRFSKTTIYCGEPLVFTDKPIRKPSRQEVDDVTTRVLEAIAALRPCTEEQGALAAGRG